MKNRQLGNFRLEDEIGRGAMGTVYAATQETLGRPAAVKVLHPALVLSDVQKQRFEREAKTIAALSHPNIIEIYDAQIDQDVAWYAMELSAGDTVADQLARGALPVARALEIARDVARALDLMHGRGVLHRDVKPSNVLLFPDGAVKVSDFGLALSPGDESLTSLDHAVGTKRYLPPERLRGGEHTEACDIYALGVVLFEMLAGKNAFAADAGADGDERILAGDIGDLPQACPSANEWVCAIAACATATDPEDRFRSASEMVDALELALADPGLSRAAGAPVDASASPGVFTSLTSSVDLFIMKHVDEGRPWLGRLRRRAALRVRATGVRMKRNILLRHAALADAVCRRRRIEQEMRRLERLRKRLGRRASHHGRIAGTDAPRDASPLETTLTALDGQDAQERTVTIAGEIERLDAELAHLADRRRDVAATIDRIQEEIDLAAAGRTGSKGALVWRLLGFGAIAALFVALMWLSYSGDGLATGPVGPLHDAREHATACRISGPRAVIVGGIHTADGSRALDSIEVFQERRFRLLDARLARPTFNHAMVDLGRDRLLITGGEAKFDGSAYREIVLVDLKTPSAEDIAVMTLARRRHRAVRLDNGQVFIIGGEDDLRADDRSSIETFDPDAASCAVIAEMPVYLQDFTATPLSGGKALIVGGQDRDRKPLAGVFEFDSQSRSVKRVADLITPRYEHAAILLADGRILITGGFGRGNESLADVEVLDATTYQPRAAAPMSHPRGFHSAAVAGDSVLVTGGRGGKTLVDTMELYDVARNRWTPAGETLARNNHVLVRLTRDRFLIAGGYAAGEVLRDARIISAGLTP